jgi:predicted nucleotidyltransferase component of viral defense system
MSVERSGLAQSVQARLVRHAKQISVDPNLVLTRYGTERFLYRLSRSLYAEQFVLKGALLLLAWLGEALRPTRDADLLGFGELSDEDVLRIFREICTIEVEPDAVTFLADTIDVRATRNDDAYGGRRVTLQARLGPARIAIQVGIGDAVTPGPEWLDYPTLLDLPRPRLRAYPRETVVAEKLHAMVLLGMRNSRMKDYFDVHALLREGALDTDTLARAIAATFERRRTLIPEGLPAGLSDAFLGDAGHTIQWQAFLAKNRLHGRGLAEVVHEIRAGIAQALEAARRQTKA